jgi:hypothetical protein
MPTPSRPRRPLVALTVPIVVLVACGGTSPSPAASVVASATVPTASSTATATATAAPSSAAPSTAAGQEPTPEAAAALAAYFKAIAEPGQSFHLTQAADVSINGVSGGTFDYSLDVSGADFAAVIHATGVDVQIVALGDKMWTKQGTADWKAAAPDDAIVQDIVSVFRYAGGPEDLVFVETSTVNGQTVHRFQNAAPLPYQTASMRESGTIGSIPQITLSITDAGVPLGFAFSTTAETTVNGTKQTIESASIIEITRFGEKIAIKAPV